MNTIYTIEQIRAIVKKIAARHNTGRLYLFGSYAQGEARLGSDLNVRVDKGGMRDLLDLGALYADLSDAFEVPVELVTTESLSAEDLSGFAAVEILLYDPERPR